MGAHFCPTGKGENRMFYFIACECCPRRLPSIKTIDGVEEVSMRTFISRGRARVFVSYDLCSFVEMIKREEEKRCAHRPPKSEGETTISTSKKRTKTTKTTTTRERGENGYAIIEADARTIATVESNGRSRRPRELNIFVVFGK